MNTEKIQNLVEKGSDWRSHYIVRNIINSVNSARRDPTTKIAGVCLVFLILLAMFGPMMTLYEYNERVYDEDDELVRSESPSLAHPLGTTDVGYDVFSRVVYGARPTVIAGAIGGAMIVTIGTTVGLISGYFGGRIDDLLMRITDFGYSIPIIPFAIVLAAFLGANFYSVIFIIGAILWRTSARVIRSQVLQIKERPFITAAKASGAGSLRIIVKHILPNVASMAILYFALGVGYTIIAQASLAFVGVSNPFIPSWGVMVRNAYNAGMMGRAWWWSIPPAILLSFTVLSAFMFGRGYESATGSQSTNTITE